MKKNILIVGVGGQGTILASKLLGQVAQNLNLDVKLSEVHGMAQRGGSVVTHVKIDNKVYSPLIDKGEADVVIAFEKLEALRWAQYLSENGTLIYNNTRLNPVSVTFGKMKYPENVKEKLSDICKNLFEVDALEMAKKAGNAKALNTVMIGLLAQSLDISKDIFINAIKETVPERLLEVNLKAFDEGYNYKN